MREVARAHTGCKSENQDPECCKTTPHWSVAYSQYKPKNCSTPSLGEKFKPCYRLIGYNRMRVEWLNSEELGVLMRFVDMSYQNEELRITFLFSFCPTGKIPKFSGNLWRNCPWSWGSAARSSRGREIGSFSRLTMDREYWLSWHLGDYSTGSPGHKQYVGVDTSLQMEKLEQRGKVTYTKSQYHLVLTQQWNPSVWILSLLPCLLGTALAQG